MKLTNDQVLALLAIGSRALGDRVPEAAKPHLAALLEAGAVEPNTWGKPGNVTLTEAGLERVKAEL